MVCPSPDKLLTVVCPLPLRLAPVPAALPVRARRVHRARHARTLGAEPRGAQDAIAAESSHNHFRIPKTTFSRSRIHRCGETHSLLLPLPSLSTVLVYM